MVGTIVHQLTKGASIEEIKAAGLGAYYTDHGVDEARATYEKLIDLCHDEPDIIDPLRFLREREVVHFQRFGEALRGIQDKLADKKYYMNNCNNPCMN